MPSLDTYIKKSDKSVSILKPRLSDFKSFEEYSKFMTEFDEASESLKAEIEEAIAAEAALEDERVADLMKEDGFVNLHATNKKDGKGDGKWYDLSSGKTQHDGDTAMTRGEAIAAMIELG